VRVCPRCGKPKPQRVDPRRKGPYCQQCATRFVDIRRNEKDGGAFIKRLAQRGARDTSNAFAARNGKT
jgi:hypothetical protein